MNRNKAYEVMIKGEKIRNESWVDGAYTIYREGKFIFCKDEYEADIGTCMRWEDGYVVYQEPEPVRKLVAWEVKVNGIAHGTIELCLSDSESSIYKKEHSNAYRKLSDSELKELIKGVIGE